MPSRGDPLSTRLKTRRGRRTAPASPPACRRGGSG
jgi:hypothetical protein